MTANNGGQKRPTLRSVLIQKGKMDIGFLSVVLIILTIGLVMLYSASHYNAMALYGDSNYFIRRQIGFAGLGLVVMFLVSKIDYRFYRRLAIPWILYVVTCGLLVAVLLMPPMNPALPFARRWFYIGSFNFQPSEVAKFSLILLLSHLVASNYRKMPTFKYGFLFMLFLVLLPTGLVAVETHLSAAVILFLLGILLMVVGGTRFLFLAVAGGIGGGLGAAAILTGLIGHGSSRIQTWLDPFNAPKDAAYQIIQSLYAIGSGGFLGRGIGNSRQKYLYVPEPQNDFIFPIVVEELGFVGGAFIILLYAVLVWRGFTIAMRAPDKFGSMLALGLTFQVGLQAVFNIFVVTNTIPNTGISLPFFSYGGTSLVMLLAQMGVVLSVSRAASLKKM